MKLGEIITHGKKLGYKIPLITNAHMLTPRYLERQQGIWDLDSGKLLSEVKNSTSVSHGIAISPDSKYAFISVEGIGGEPGIVDVINLETLELISSVKVGKQAGGIAFWKISD